MAGHMITAAISKAVCRYITSRVSETPSARGTMLELRIAPSLKWPAVVALGLLATAFSCFAWSAYQASDRDPLNLPLSALVAMFVLGIIYLMALLATKTARFDPQGLTVTFLGIQSQRIWWQDIIDYSYSKLLTTHKFKTTHKGTVRLPIILSGLPVFFKMLEERNADFAGKVREAAANQVRALSELG